MPLRCQSAGTANLVKLILSVYEDFGFKDYSFRLSLRDKEDKVKFTTLKTYRDRQKFFKNLENVKLKDFNIEHFEKWKKEINSYGYTTNHKNHLFKFFKELLNYATKWYNFNFTATYNKMTNFT